MSKFDSFVIFAEMRTGSNLLEAALNALEGVTCHGEAFNPALIGYPKRTELLGVTREDRDADPMVLWRKIRSAPGLNGCRYFHNHDARVFEAMLKDPKCAKIVLTCNPIESYVSLMIARATGQWKLGDAKHRKAAQAEFDAREFEEHLATLQGFQILLMNALQTSGQTAFYIDYEDAQSVEVLNGLAAWLGVEARLSALPDVWCRKTPSRSRPRSRTSPRWRPRSRGWIASTCRAPRIRTAPGRQRARLRGLQGGVVALHAAAPRTRCADPRLDGKPRPARG